MREGGLEPPSHTAPDPKSGVSANSTTPAELEIGEDSQSCGSREYGLGNSKREPRSAHFEPQEAHFGRPKSQVSTPWRFLLVTALLYSWGYFGAGIDWGTIIFERGNEP